MPTASLLLLAGPMMALLFGVITGLATRHGWFGLLAGILTAPLLLALSLNWLGWLGYEAAYSLVGWSGSWIGNKLVRLHRPLCL